MGGGSSTDCCKNNQIPGPCPVKPNIQCTQIFLDDCDGINSICTTFIQTTPGVTSAGTCSATQPCCVPQTTGNLQVDAALAWLYDDPNNQCPASAVCGTIDFPRCIVNGLSFPDVCAGGSTSSGVTNDNISTNKSRSVPVTCKWNAESFRTLENVQAWVAASFPQNDPEVKKVYDTQIMPILCSTPQIDTPTEKNCPASNSIGDWVGGVCSPYVATNPTGSYCRSWLVSLGNESDVVSTVNKNSILAYCGFLADTANRNPNAGLMGGEANECLCINRGLGGPTGPFIETRDALTGAGATGDNGSSLPEGSFACWYVPCNSDPTQLKPAGDKSTQPDYYPSGCPSVCKIVNNISGKIINSKINENINCVNTGPTPPNQGGSSGNGNGSSGNGNGDPTTTESFWQKYKWLVIGIAAFILLIIIGFVIFMVYEEEKKK